MPYLDELFALEYQPLMSPGASARSILLINARRLIKMLKWKAMHNNFLA